MRRNAKEINNLLAQFRSGDLSSAAFVNNTKSINILSDIGFIGPNPKHRYNLYEPRLNDQLKI